MNPQTLPMPAMNYSASPSPQMISMAPYPMMPMMDITSITPPPVLTALFRQFSPDPTH